MKAAARSTSNRSTPYSASPPIGTTATPNAGSVAACPPLVERDEVNVASGAFVRLRQATTTPGSTSAMRSQTWTVSVMGRLAVRIVPVESGFTSLAAMSFWAPASRRLGHDVAVREVGLVAGQELRLLLAPCTMSCAGAHPATAHIRCA